MTMTIADVLKVLKNDETKLVNPKYSDEQLKTILDMTIRNFEAWDKVQKEISNTYSSVISYGCEKIINKYMIGEKS